MSGVLSDNTVICASYSSSQKNAIFGKWHYRWIAHVTSNTKYWLIKLQSFSWTSFNSNGTTHLLNKLQSFAVDWRFNIIFVLCHQPFILSQTKRLWIKTSSGYWCYTSGSNRLGISHEIDSDPAKPGHTHTFHLHTKHKISLCFNTTTKCSCQVHAKNLLHNSLKKQTYTFKINTLHHCLVATFLY